MGNTRLASDILGNISLEDIYLNINQRKNLALNLSRSLNIIKNIEEGKQCKDELVNHIHFQKLLCSGFFGEVSIANIIDMNHHPKNNYKKFNFAVKMAAVPKLDKSYIELRILKLLRELVFNGKAQNFPIIMDSYKCDICKFKETGRKTVKCLFTINEVASIDLSSWLKTSPSKDELNSCLFQIMAGIHALQHHYLILNNDIKSPNILVYNVNPGGYWKYTIYGLDFYVPNYGKLFIVNDYGVSSIFSQNYIEKDISIGSVKYPIEHAYDTQDAIRIFTGGQIMTVRQEEGFHAKFPMDRKFISNIQKYILFGLFSNSKTLMTKIKMNLFDVNGNIDDLPKMLAGNFILDYFSKVENYRVPKNIDLIISHINTS